MSKRYRGDNRLGRVQPEAAPGHSLKLKMPSRDVHFFMKVMEGYTHLAFPVADNPKEGCITLHTTPDCLEELHKIIYSFPRPITILP